MGFKPLDLKAETLCDFCATTDVPTESGGAPCANFTVLISQRKQARGSDSLQATKPPLKAALSTLSRASRDWTVDISLRSWSPALMIMSNRTKSLLPCCSLCQRPLSSFHLWLALSHPWTLSLLLLGHQPSLSYC